MRSVRDASMTISEFIAVRSMIALLLICILQPKQHQATFAKKKKEKTFIKSESVMMQTESH